MARLSPKSAAKEHDFNQALKRSVFYTISATFMAAFATSISYSILSVTTFRGFSQFGFIGGIGMVMCWLALTITLSCFTALFERWRRRTKAKYAASLNATMRARWPISVHRYRKIFTYSLYIIVPLSIAGTYLYARVDRFEYDSKKLTIKVISGAGSEQYFMRRIDTVLGNGSNASMLIAHDREDAHRTAQALEKKNCRCQSGGKTAVYQFGTLA
ncbi:MAG: MMPL family transporter [Turneriella sp.]